MDRATFEELVAPFMDNIEKALKDCLETSKLKVEDIYSVEIIGGSSRIPKIKSMIEKVYSKSPSTTLNADEAVSRGCALQCAILSPTFKVREFSVVDIQPYPIKLVWDNHGGIENQGPGEMEVFPAFHAVPFSKMLTFFKSDTFQVAGEYVTDVPFPGRHIGLFEIGDVRPTADGGNQKVKVKVRINPNGIFGVSSANLVEKHEIEEEVPVEMEVDQKENGEKKEEENKETEAGAEEPKKEESKMETEEAKKEEPKKDVKMEKRKKIVNKTIDLPVSQRVQGQLNAEKMQVATNEEMEMAKQDRNEADRLTAKNSVEEYIYEIRGKLCEELEDFMLEEDRNKYSLELEDAENWLYEDGEYADKPEYTQKLSQLKSKGEAVRKRRNEFLERPGAINQFGQCLQLAQKAVDSYKAGDEKFAHLDNAEVEKVQKAIGEKQEWFSRMCAEIQKLQKTSDPPVLASQFLQEKESFWHMASNILNKPKPKVEPPPPAPADSTASKEETMDTPSDNTSEANANINAEATNGQAKVNGNEVPGEMDVD